MNHYQQRKPSFSAALTGMGRAMVEALLAGGADVLLTGRNERNIKAASSATALTS